MIETLFYLSEQLWSLLGLGIFTIVLVYAAAFALAMVAALIEA